jgi:Tfp pilus assembly protein PilP
VAVGTLPQKNTKGAKSGPAAGKGAKKQAVASTVAKKTPATASTGKSGKPSVAKVEAPPRAEPKPATPAKLLGAAGRRDPFVSPIRSASAVSPASACTSGKRCLAIPELILQGTVRDVSGKMMAVVSTSNRRTYTLRENDQVFNGSVEKITSDSIIFREYVRDALGRESAREVVKKLGPTS